MLLNLFACQNVQEEPTGGSTQQETEVPTEKPASAPTDEQTADPTEEQTAVTEEDITATSTEDTVADVTEESAVTTIEDPTVASTENPTAVPTEEITDSPTVESETTTTENPTETTSESETTTEKETNEMQTEVKYDDIASVGIHDKYDLDSYMAPIWSGKVVHNETVMFVGIDDQASLLYDADRIISVRSYDLSIEYVQGVDYDYVDGKLVLLEGTRIPYVPLETYYSVLDPEYPYLSTMYQGQVTQTMFGDDDTMTKWQVAVTYKHSDTWEGKEVESYEDRFASFIGKLENGEDVTVFFYGDSITTGATSSQSRAPYAPSYPRMFVQYVAKQYGYTVKYIDSYSDSMLTNGKPSGGQAYPDTVFGTNGTITYINTAVGGWSSKSGIDNIREYVIKYIKAYGCDLFVLAFGMNNASSEAADVVKHLSQIVQGVTRNASDTDVVLVSTMIPNPEAVNNPADKFFCNGNQPTFEEAMIPLADTWNEKIKGGCAVAPMTSVSTYIHSKKRYRDTTGNNVNHPSDFLARTYAQVIFQTVFGYKNYPSGPIDIGEIPVVDANYNAEITVGGNTLYLDGKTGTTDANYASCVRLEATNEGYFLYHVSDGAKEYINANTNGNVDYSDTAVTVWTYNATLKAMVCEGSEIAVKLVKPEICIHPLIIEEEGHCREACVRCSVKKETEAHSLTETVTKDSNDGTECTVKCSVCGYVRSSYLIPAGINHYFPISKISLFNGTDCSIFTEDGMQYQRSQFTSDGHIFIMGNNDTCKIDGDTGNYLVIKYRAAGNAGVRLDICTSDNASAWSMIEKNSLSLPSDWEIAVIALSQFENYTCDSELDVQIRITTSSSYFDIAYAAITDTVKEAESLMEDDAYVLYTDWAGTGTVYKVGDADDGETSEPEIRPETPTQDVNVSVGVHDEFDLDSYMTPIWDGNVVHNETVLFVGPDDTPTLLYDPDKIISVCSYDLSIEYIEGVDFEIVDGKIVRLEGSRIPYIPFETYYSVHNNMPYLSTMVNGVVTQTMFGEGDTMCKWQVAITYKHSDTWEGPELESYTDRYAGLIEKLENGEDVTFFFYGDSITAGENSSEAIGKAPYTPIWARMFTMYVAKQYGYTVKFLETSSDAALQEAIPGGGGAYADKVYGTNGTITYINNAVSGWSTGEGNAKFDTYVKAYLDKYGCDLFVLAFGMNNVGTEASELADLLDQIVVKVEACAPDADVLLVSTMLPNPEAVKNTADTFFCNGNQPTFEAAMIPLAEQINERGTGCALAPMTSMTKHLYTVKRFRDTTGNNVNHPSDFVVRLYAQTLFQTVFGYENYEGSGTELDNVPVENANFNAQITVSGNTVYLDGASGTDDRNDAVCVRFEACDGGYYMYYINDSAKVYINVENGACVYADTAASVWAYDESLGAIVSGDCALTLSAPAICLHPTVVGDETHGREECIRCGIEAFQSSHKMLDGTVKNEDGSTTYSTSCQICGKLGQSHTVPAGVIYYSGTETNKSPKFYLLNHELREENGIIYTTVTPQASTYGHELHWINHNDSPYNDYSGKQLDTKGAQYLVIRLRASSDDISMSFRYKLLDSSSLSISIPVVSEGEWITYVLDLKSIGADKYQALSDGTYTMQYFKMYLDTGFDQIKNAYVDFEYLALCDSFEQIGIIANADTVQLMTVSGSVTEIGADRTCMG